MKNKNNIDPNDILHSPILAIRGWPTVLATVMLGAAAFASVVMSTADAADDTQDDGDVIETPFPGWNNGPYHRTPILGVVAGQSVIRFANMRDEGSTTNYVEVFGLDTRETLASFEVEVPAKASLEIRPELMVQTFAPVNYDQPLVVYVENGREKQLWQHIQYDGDRGILSEASACTFAPHADYIPPGHVALNVLAGGLARYMSFVTVHNFSDEDAAFAAHVYDSASGRELGTVTLDIGARESFSESGLWYFYEAGLVYTGEDQQNLNIEFVPVEADSGARLAVGHEVYDLFTGSSVNLSNPCPIHGGIITIPPLPAPQ